MTTIEPVRRAREHTDSQFVQRWSPRAYTSQAIPAEHLHAIFDAARWAPSCFNEQPWRLYTATRDQAAFGDYAQVLLDANRSWAANAYLLGFIVAKQHFTHNGKANAHANFDAGAA